MACRCIVVTGRGAFVAAMSLWISLASLPKLTMADDSSGDASGKGKDSPPIVWKYTWPADGTQKPTASICPMKYGKRWGYAVEFDDGRVFAKTIALPLLSKFEYTDAPPGISGGTARSFVAGVAVNPPSVGGNNAGLSWDDLKMLESKGWGVIDHSYWHTGCHWDPQKKLDADQFRRELYWGQTLFGHELNGGQHAPSQFVYPNGDYNYAPYLHEFGLRYGSHVGGKDVMPYKDGFDPLRVKRSYLDEGVWKKQADNTMLHFPKDGPADAMLFVDFTHGIQEPDTENHTRWTKRLTTIAETYGRGGKDDLWSAPTYEILDYTTAAKAANVNASAGQLVLTLPADVPPSALTIKLEGVNPQTKLPVPKGGLVYRRGSTAWITTPPLGSCKVAMPQPLVKRVHSGPYQAEITLEKPIRLAAVRIFQQGKPVIEKLAITLTSPDGETQPLDTDRIHKWVPLRSRWGYWMLYPTLPDIDPPLVSKITLPDGEKAFKNVEVWAVVEKGG